MTTWSPRPAATFTTPVSTDPKLPSMLKLFHEETWNPGASVNNHWSATLTLPDTPGVVHLKSEATKNVLHRTLKQLRDELDAAVKFLEGAAG